MTLTFNLPEQMFQMTPLLVKEKNWAKLLKFMHKRKDMARTTQFMTILSFDLKVNKCSQWHFYSSRSKKLCQINLKFMHKCRTYGSNKFERTDRQLCRAQCMWARQKKIIFGLSLITLLLWNSKCVQLTPNCASISYAQQIYTFIILFFL